MFLFKDTEQAQSPRKADEHDFSKCFTLLALSSSGTHWHSAHLHTWAHVVILNS